MPSFWRSLPGVILGHRLAQADNRPTTAGAAIYSPLFLNVVYDRLVLGFYCSYVWRCSSAVIDSLYRVLIFSSSSSSLNVLDIGVGTGFFLATAPIPQDTSLTLFDLNPACLDAAFTRCRAAHRVVPGFEVNTVCGDFLAPEIEPTSIHSLLGGRKFDIIFTNMLLHCVPGPPRRKALALASLSPLVEPDSGVLAGVTILGKGVRHSFLGRFIMFWHNWLGMFDNHDDDAEVFVEALQEAFDDVKWRVVGTVLVFEARRPKSI